MKVIKVSRFVYDLLTNNESITVHVHSIYNSTCNLESEHYGLISLLTENKEMNPVSIMLDTRLFPRCLSLGDKIELSRIQFHDSYHQNTGCTLFINLDDVEIFESNLPNHQNNFLISTVMFADFLCFNEKEMGIYSLFCSNDNTALTSQASYYSSFMSEYIQPYLNQFINDLKSKNNAIDLKHIIGFGSGLTPSMDDVLVGLMSFLKYTKHEYFDIISKACLPHVNRTTDISKEMLLLATKKQFNEGVVNIYNSTNNKSLFMKNLTHLLKYGHSSGHDTLCGIYFGMRWFSQNED